MKRALLALVFVSPMPAQEVTRITNPPVAGPCGSSGWQVDPGRGYLSVTIPAGTVPGPLPIPLAFSMNGTFSTHCQNVLILRQGVLSAWMDVAVHGTVGFGYLGWGKQNAKEGDKVVVLEDGRTYAEAEFKSYAVPSPYARHGSALLGVYGIAGTPSSSRISSDGKTLWATFPAGGMGARSGEDPARHVPAGYGPVKAWDLIIDKDRARFFAQVDSVAPSWLQARLPKGGQQNAVIGLPVLWLDKFGHSVTFQWTRDTSALPPDVESIVKVEARNDHGRGVTVRYAAWKDNLVVHDLLRADFVGFEGPSMLMRGYSGTALLKPQGFTNPFGQWAVGPPRAIHLAGVVARPTTLTLGEPDSMRQPDWSDTGSPASAAPVMTSTGAFQDPRTWHFVYDENQAALTSMRSPTLVRADFTNNACYTLFHGPGTLPSLVWGVTRVEETDESGEASAGHVVTWNRTLPRPKEQQWDPADWVVTSREGWTQGGPVLDGRITTYTYVRPTESLLDYRNMTLRSIQVTDGACGSVTTIETSTQNNQGGGLDGSLSFPRSVTSQRGGENGRRIAYTYTDATCLQAHTIASSVLSGGDPQPFKHEVLTYNDRWRMLEGAQIKRIETTRYAKGLALLPSSTVVKEWDEGNLLQVRKTFLDAGADQHGQAFTYDADGNVATEDLWHREGGVVLRSPARQTLGYDPETGLPSSWTTTFEDGADGKGTITRRVLAFDRAGRPAVQVDEKGVEIHTAFDLFGRETYSATQGSEPIETQYPGPGESRKTQGGRTTTSHFDGFGRLIGEELPDGTRSVYAFDLNGQPASTTRTSTTGQAVTRTTVHDLFGRLAEETGFDGVRTTFDYQEAEGGIDQVSRLRGNEFESVTDFDPFGQVVEVRHANGDRVEKTYDGLGGLQSLAVASGEQHVTQRRECVHDGLGRLTMKKEPETGTTVFGAFNALNLPTLIKEEGGRVRTDRFDGLGRIRSRVAKDRDQVAGAQFMYSGALLATTTRTSSAGPGPVSQQFDYYPPERGARLRTESTVQPGLTTRVGYAYTPFGDLETLTYPSGRVVNYGFDPLGRAVSVTSTLDGKVLKVVPEPAASPFDEWGRRASLTFSSGARELWNLDGTHARIGSHLVVPKAGAPLGWSYGYDPAKGLLQSTGEWTLHHDRLGRLIQASQEWALVQEPEGGLGTRAADLLTFKMDHDAFGNTTLATYLGPEPPSGALNAFQFALPMIDNRLPSVTTSSGTVNAAYTPCGELQSIAKSVGSRQYLDFTWDPLGTLAAMGQTPAGSVETYQYTAAGLRVGRSTSNDPSGNRKYAYRSDGLLLTESRAGGSGGLDVIYLGDRALAEIDEHGLHELHCDHLGTPRVITGGGTGVVEGAQTFGPYGERLSGWGYVPLTGFTGHIQTESNGLIYMKGRFYSPAWHRFSNSDMGSDPNSPNQYAYCGGSPMGEKDPSGLLGEFLIMWLLEDPDRAERIGKAWDNTRDFFDFGFHAEGQKASAADGYGVTRINPIDIIRSVKIDIGGVNADFKVDLSKILSETSGIKTLGPFTFEWQGIHRKEYILSSTNLDLNKNELSVSVGGQTGQSQLLVMGKFGVNINSFNTNVSIGGSVSGGLGIGMHGKAALFERNAVTNSIDYLKVSTGVGFGNVSFSGFSFRPIH